MDSGTNANFSQDCTTQRKQQLLTTLTISAAGLSMVKIRPTSVIGWL